MNTLIGAILATFMLAACTAAQVSDTRERLDALRTQVEDIGAAAETALQAAEDAHQKSGGGVDFSTAGLAAGASTFLSWLLDKRERALADRDRRNA